MYASAFLACSAKSWGSRLVAGRIGFRLNRMLKSRGRVKYADAACRQLQHLDEHVET